ncbi:MAG: lipid-binding SYLF domain-containing protein [Candidatus Omnitrophota bacterium]
MTKFRIPVIALILISLITFAVNAQAGDNKWTRLVDESGKVLSEVQEMPDQSIPGDLLAECQAIAVFPSTISAGFMLGGQYGQGIIMVRGENGGKWSPPAVFTIAGGSLGFQIGGQATDIVLLIMNRRSIDGLLQGQFKLGGDASVAAGPVGRSAAAATDVQLKGGILSYSRSRGLFAGIKLDGAAVTQHWDGNAELYGKSLSARQILLENKAKMPDAADRILKLLNKYP